MEKINYKLMTCILVFVLSTNLVFALNVTFICSQAYDFIIDSNLNYTTLEISNLTNKINKELESSLSTDTILNYLVNYDSKCSFYEKLPYDIQITILKNSIQNEEKSFYFKYKYEIIFCTLILLGILAMEYLKKKRRKHEKNTFVNNPDLY